MIDPEHAARTCACGNLYYTSRRFCNTCASRQYMQRKRDAKPRIDLDQFLIEFDQFMTNLPAQPLQPFPLRDVYHSLTAEQLIHRATREGRP